jgi:hypothetical protein
MSETAAASMNQRRFWREPAQGYESRDVPHLYKGAMVRRLLADEKTVTRRIVKLRDFMPSSTPGYNWDFRDRRGQWNSAPTAKLLEMCPYGRVGDWMWAKETWALTGDQIIYRADGPEDEDRNWKWRPSIFMPKDRSRITRLITHVGVERLSDITDSDARCEGIQELFLQDGEPGAWWTSDRWAGPELHGRTPVEAYRKLWEFINGAGSWGPHWVWVIRYMKDEP